MADTVCNVINTSGFNPTFEFPWLRRDREFNDGPIGLLRNAPDNIYDKYPEADYVRLLVCTRSQSALLSISAVASALLRRGSGKQSSLLSGQMLPTGREDTPAFLQ